MSNELDYKKIIKLMDFKFCIPSYQRGYRWDESNIIKFIEDIYEDKSDLLKTILSKGLEKINGDDLKNQTEYCIQPLIVKKENKLWNVIDGQQRLTTIFIMIAVLNIYETNDSGKSRLSIDYKSRKMSKEFLEFLFKTSKNDESINIWRRFKEANGEIEKNIDFDYMENAFHTAYKCFKNFLEKNEIYESKESFGCLLFILLNFCKFIWYPIENDSEDEREKFAKVNMGKIELTDAELIKAEFMNPNNYEMENINQVKIRQTIIAESWYAIETELHKPDFWAFIPHENQYGEKDEYKTRIDVLFHFLLLENWIEKNEGKSINEYFEENGMKVNEEHFLFYEVKKWIEEEQKNDSLNKNEIMELCWGRVVDIFQSLKEIYEDDGREVEWKTNKNEQGFYNLIGFLIYAYNFQKDSKHFITSKESTVDRSIKKALKIYYEIYDLLKKEPRYRVKAIKEKIKAIVFSTNIVEEKENIKSIIKKMEYKGLYSDKIAIVLLLYNIILINNSTGIGNRYNFLQHAKEKWSREHIFPQEAKEFVKDKNERKELLKILLKGLTNKVIVIKNCSVLNYVNYKYKDGGKCCPIDGLKNKGIIDLNEEIVRDFIQNRIRYNLEKENREEMYEAEYAKSLHLMKKSQEILEMYDILEESEKNLSEKVPIIDQKLINDKKVNYIFKHKDLILNYNQDILFSNIFELKEDKIDKFIHECLIDKKMIDFFKILSEKVGMIGDSTYKRINIKVQEYYEYYEYISNSEVENDNFSKENLLKKINETIKEIKQIIREIYDDKINKIVVYDIDIKHKIYSLIVECKSCDEIKEIINKDKFPELGNSNQIEDIIKKMDINDIDSKFLDSVIKISYDTIVKIINDFFENEYVKLLNDNSMGNMTLLDVQTNGDSKIGNKPYNIKKEKIYSKMKKGIFIPLSTILVFTDPYTNNLGVKIHWLPESRMGYLKDMINTICDFFGEKVNER